jgi:hypothetical protein
VKPSPTSRLPEDFQGSGRKKRGVESGPFT